MSPVESTCRAIMRLFAERFCSEKTHVNDSAITDVHEFTYFSSIVSRLSPNGMRLAWILEAKAVQGKNILVEFRKNHLFRNRIGLKFQHDSCRVAMDAPFMHMHGCVETKGADFFSLLALYPRNNALACRSLRTAHVGASYLPAAPKYHLFIIPIWLNSDIR